jgi:hypothetical protein
MRSWRLWSPTPRSNWCTVPNPARATRKPAPTRAHAGRRHGRLGLPQAARARAVEPDHAVHLRPCRARRAVPGRRSTATTTCLLREHCGDQPLCHGRHLGHHRRSGCAAGEPAHRPAVSRRWWTVRRMPRLSRGFFATGAQARVPSADGAGPQPAAHGRPPGAARASQDPLCHRIRMGRGRRAAAWATS